MAIDSAVQQYVHPTFSPTRGHSTTTPSRCSTRGRSGTRRRRRGAPQKRATDALVLAREGEEPQPAGQARRALLRLSALDPAFDILQGQYHTRAGLLHVNCFYDGNCEQEQEMGRPHTGYHRVHRPGRAAIR